MLSLFQYSIAKKNTYISCFIYCFLFFSCCKTSDPDQLKLCNVQLPKSDEIFATVIDPDEVILMMHAVQTVYNQTPFLDGYTQIESITYNDILNNEQEGIDSNMLADIARENGSIWSYIYRNNSEPKDLIIAIRGTESIMDWIKNLQIKMVPFVSFSGLQKNGTVEQGFYGIYKSLRAKLFSVIEQERPERLRITGHSLGGSIALFLAYDIALSAPVITQPQLFTYGMPRTGNQGFIEEIKQISIAKSAKLTFIVNNKDLVPELPPTLFGYQTIPFSNYKFCFDAGNPIENHLKYESALRKLFKR